MKKNYKYWFIAFLCFFVSKNIMAQSKLDDSKYGAIISEYLNANKTTSKTSSADIDDIYVTKELFSEKTGIANAYLNQRFKGVKIYKATSSVGIKNGRVFHFADKFESNISARINTIAPTITASQSVSKLANHFNLGHVGNIEIIEERGNKTIFTKGAVSQENISVEQVYFKDDDGTLKLAWNLNILTLDGKHWWSARVDAVSGKILDVNDWVLTCNFGDANHSNHNHANNKEGKSFNLFKTNTAAPAAVDGSTYNVFALPTESPNHGPRTIVTEPADATASPFGWHDDDGIVGAEYTDTQGNNVITKEDIAGNNGSGGNKADGGVSLNFDFPLDLTSPPAESLDASLTNLFYINNMVHDITYHYGFDEASGNFQEKHYIDVNEDGTGDPVFADGLDGSGLNNANFGTPPDGSSPRMQMFLFESSNGDPLNINGGSLKGGYSAFPAGFGGALSETPLTADLALSTDDNSGDSTDSFDACDAITNGSALVGKIAVINRGTCEFGDKLLAVQNAGAVAAIVITDDRPVGVMGPGANGASVTIPGIMISRADGDAIIAALNNSETINASLIAPTRIDGSYDNGVIIHEYGHGISNRLTGGATDSDCLLSCTRTDDDGRCIPAFDTEQMGEGWSDWFGLMLTMKASDVGTTGRGIGTFDADQATDGTGFRRFKYSTDTAINPTTYGDTNDVTNFRAPHGVGSIWAGMLWDLTWAYIEKYGFDSDLLDGTGGNNKVMQIVMDGMKLQVCQPGFVDGRDGILAADMGLTGGEDQCMIWEIFAARGLGVNADQGKALSRKDQTEDFDMPDARDASFANCTTLSATDFNSNDYQLYPNPARTKLTIKASRSMGDVVIDLVDINGRKVFSKSVILSGEVELNIGALQSGLYILRIKGDAINANEKIIIK